MKILPAGAVRAIAATCLLCAPLAPVALATPPVSPPIVRRPALSPDGAWAMLEACKAFAQKNNWHVSIAVVDGGAALMAFFRMDDTSINSINSALQKAKTSALIRLPTKDLADGASKGEGAALTAAQQLAMGFYAAQGGLPIKVDGVIAGAIAASGESPARDEQCARVGMQSVLK